MSLRNTQFMPENMFFIEIRQYSFCEFDLNKEGNVIMNVCLKLLLLMNPKKPANELS